MKDKIVGVFKAIGKGLTGFLKALPLGKIREKISWRWLLIALGFILLFMFLVAFYWSRAPGRFDVRQIALKKAGGDDTQIVTGYVTTATLIHTADTLLNKRGGYLTNDVTPPSIFIDDMPNWEFGVLVQIRDLAQSLRNDMSRSRSASIENTDLAKASPLFNYDNNSWIFPSSESQYRKGIGALERYLDGLAKQDSQDTQFFARADNLRDWLAVVEKRLGSLSQRLSASVGQKRINTDLAGDAGATQSTATSETMRVKTSWWKIDNVFFEARGSCWALIHFFKAIEVDFADVLDKKNARALVEQIIRDLEGTQRAIWSPMILNGSGFGFTANHSLVLGSYISRANTAVIDLRDLLSQG